MEYLKNDMIKKISCGGVYQCIKNISVDYHYRQYGEKSRELPVFVGSIRNYGAYVKMHRGEC